MRFLKWKRLTTAMQSIVLLTSVTASIVVSASPVAADTWVACNNGGVHAVWARGTDADIGEAHIDRFMWPLWDELSDLHINLSWAELGNLDGNAINNRPNEQHEYPAWPYPYPESVEKGRSELVDYLEWRAQHCPYETIVLGGFSQGADVVDLALWSLSAYARSRIGYVALYGDPKFNAGCDQDAWWARGDSWIDKPCANGVFGARNPYAPEDLKPGSRVGSWCDGDDNFCTGGGWMVDPGNHGYVYKDFWIARSRPAIVEGVRSKVHEITSILWFIKTINTSSGRVEVHNANPTNYTSGSINLPTRFSPADNNNGWWQIVGQDLWFIKTRNTAGQVEIHTATYLSGYNSGESRTTRFSPADAGNGWFQMNSVGDLWFVKTRNTSSGRVEIHTATRASGYSTGASFTTRFSPADQNNGFFQIVGQDLFFIKIRNTGSGSVEIHGASAPSGYQNGQSTVTSLSPADQYNGSFQMVGPHLVLIKTRNTGSGRVEVHSKLDYTVYTLGASKTTYFSPSDHANGWWQVANK